MVGAGSAAAKCELRPARTAGGVKSGSAGGEGLDGGGGRSWCWSRAPRTRVSPRAPAVSSCTALLCLCSAPLGAEPWGGGVLSLTLPVLPLLAPRSWARAGPRNCRRGRCSAFPPAARAHCSGGEGVSAASRSRVGTRPPSPGLGPVPCSRGPFPAQGPAAAAGRAPRGGWAGVFNGSMLPAAGAAPGQAGPPARPQSPRSHQLQLQLRALRLPQSPAALTGKSPSQPGAHTWELLSLFPSSYTPSPPRHPLSSPFTQTQRCPLFGAL